MDASRRFLITEPRKLGWVWLWPADLARRLKTTPQAVNRPTTLRHSNKIDGLVEAFAALGKKLELRVA